MKVIIVYIEELLFGWIEVDGIVIGVDFEFVVMIFWQIGVIWIEYCLMMFGELLFGVVLGYWDMNVLFFVMLQCVYIVVFSVLVWGIEDGFLVCLGNLKVFRCYVLIVECFDVCFGIIVGQVQYDFVIVVGVSWW